MPEQQKGPAAGAAVQNKSREGQPSVVKDAHEAEGSVIKGPAVGTLEAPNPSDGVVLEGLGNLNQADAIKEDDPNAGSGEYVVVMFDHVTGVSGGFKKGDVRRISNLISGYGDEKRVDEARANAKRLFDLKAIRLATSEEQGVGHVELGLESDELRAERNKRIALEQEIENLKKMKSLDKNTPAGVPNAEGNWQ